MGKYFSKKFIIYFFTFFIAVTINWLAPRFIPGDPINTMLAQYQGPSAGKAILEARLESILGLEGSLFHQYLTFWKNLISGDLGLSITQFPRPVIEIVKNNIIYDIIVLLPAISLSWIIGNKVGAMAGDNDKADHYVMPVFYAFVSSPYFWFAIIVVFIFAHTLGWFPTARAYSPGLRPAMSAEFIIDFVRHWFLPFITMFLIGLGGWAIGMRNMVIYEVESNYANYMRALGAKQKLIRRYAFRNGVLPQVTGLAIQLGQIISGAITVQVVFDYPGLGRLMFQAVNQKDFFLLQGSFLSLILMVLAANFLIDIIYMFIDPRVRISYSEEA
ncbi:MAG: ABC transporter permease [Bacillota bacterium]